MFDFLKPKVPQSSVDDVKKLLDTKAKIVVLDVRTPQEYQKGHIENSINIPVDAIQKEVTTKISDKKTPIYVYCLSGSRSIFAVDMMIKLGYTHVFDITNGLLAWRAKQYPLENK
ncbi:MAG: rhodanese-like domain-containing protein [Candidatus Levybacteria bacterium]|nr:rhodanese-like domain-containing protein [Candidatus Levybacteria bacterium]